MGNFIISTIYILFRNYVGGEVFDRVRVLVFSLMNLDISGDEKRQKVREAAKKEFDNISTMMIDTIIQIVLLKFAK